jgi:hypothetical protein
MRSTIQVPSERLSRLRHIPSGMPSDAMTQVSTPQCPNCSRDMVLSHKFYAEPDGPRLWHFHCIACKIGLTEAEKKSESVS